jgi:hypothetical protein
MSESERHELIRRYWASSASREDLSDEVYHDDAVLEFPQSGERSRAWRTSGSGETSTRRR